MKTSTILSTFAAVLPAFAAPTKRDAPTTFSGMSLRSASPIHFGAINANDREFWIGKDTSSSCPTEVVTDCPAGNSTVFSGGNDTLSLSTVVPGGQQVFVAADGSLSFTGPHSADQGEGSVATGFSTESGYLTFGGSGFAACPVGEDYQIFASSKLNTTATDCLGFSWLVLNATAPGAWEYA